MKRLFICGQVAAGLIIIFLFFVWMHPISAQTAAVPTAATAEDQISVPQKSPYALSFYDGLLAELAVARQQKATAELALQLSKRSLENIDTHSDKAEAEWRALTEKIEKQPNGSADPKQKWRLKKINCFHMYFNYWYSGCQNFCPLPDAAAGLLCAS